MPDEEKIPPQPSSEEEEVAPLKVSRRDFLIGTGAGVIATGAVAAGYIALTPPKTVEVVKEVVKEVPQQAGPASSGEAPVAAAASEDGLMSVKPINITINGQQQTINVDVRWTLKDLLREHLQLTGTKTGCNDGTCGFCTVIVNDRNIYSCAVLAASLDGANVVTVEGLANGAELHPVQRAFWDEMGFQCAMCTPGFIMSSVALLNRNPNPTIEEVRDGVSGNLCRCGSYPKVFNSVLAAAKMMKGA
ncbi:MAG: (2Fe-2S)-binding protein [Ardenticatenaceae bacterium]|nr:(2Fe-2S)-binding protein [Ardenticatenaceae bacterium]